MIKTQLAQAHNYFDKHDWVAMRSRDLQKVACLFDQALSLESIKMMGIKFYACTCGAMKVNNSDGKEMRLDKNE